jgi:hypothetical protein
MSSSIDAKLLSAWRLLTADTSKLDNVLAVLRNDNKVSIVRYRHFVATGEAVLRSEKVVAELKSALQLAETQLSRERCDFSEIVRAETKRARDDSGDPTELLMVAPKRAKVAKVTTVVINKLLTNDDSSSVSTGHCHCTSAGCYRHYNQTGRICSCVAHGRVCTSACKCKGEGDCLNTPVTRVLGHDSDSDTDISD